MQNLFHKTKLIRKLCFSKSLYKIKFYTNITFMVLKTCKTNLVIQSKMPNFYVYPKSLHVCKIISTKHRHRYYQNCTRRQS